ncbi:MAG: nitronate monooxygenase, partial [Bdellovibrionales bacterium]|nr:nitronate monooxygenase [Bdellovibrionales bacterium]
RALRIFLRSAKRVDRMPDYIIVEGPLAGGHLGFGADWKEHKLEQITVEVIDFLKEEGLDIPVIPAGGIFTGGDAVRYFEAGAAAVQVATRFTISKECGLPDNVKQIYLGAGEDDVEVNFSSPTGYPIRMLKSSPSLSSNIRPRCENLGYILDNEGRCQYHDAWLNAPLDDKGNKCPIREKMCICHHFMKYQCYTCGHNVFRLKDTTTQIGEQHWYLPDAEEIFNDYRYSREGKVKIAGSDRLDLLSQASKNGGTEEEEKKGSVVQLARYG